MRCWLAGWSRRGDSDRRPFHTSRRPEHLFTGICPSGGSRNPAKREGEGTLLPVVICTCSRIIARVPINMQIGNTQGILIDSFFKKNY